MIKPAYYNEIDPYVAQWLRNLIKAGHIAPGDVDERDIRDVCPADLRGYAQCHFFAGIGVWSYALRKAGWPDEREIWTGSCPCQPFSVAGMGSGFDDERHLWPFFHHLIAERRPARVYGEQVASKDGLDWLDLVQADMEGTDYAFAAVDLCAAGVGAPHIRQRLWFVADDNRRERKPFIPWWNELIGVADADSKQHNGGWSSREGRRPKPADSRSVGRLDHPHHQGLERLGRGHQAEGGRVATVRPVAAAGEFSGLADADGGGRPRNDRAQPRISQGSNESISDGSSAVRAGPTNGHWRAADWLLCRDGKWRPVEPGASPLAHGATNRVGRLRAYGNAINAEAAIAFIEATL